MLKPLPRLPFTGGWMRQLSWVWPASKIRDWIFCYGQGHTCWAYRYRYRSRRWKNCNSDSLRERRTHCCVATPAGGRMSQSTSTREHGLGGLQKRIYIYMYIYIYIFIENMTTYFLRGFECALVLMTRASRSGSSQPIRRGNSAVRALRSYSSLFLYSCICVVYISRV